VSRPSAAAYASVRTWTGKRETHSYSGARLFATTLMAAVARLRPDVVAHAVDPGLGALQEQDEALTQVRTDQLPPSNGVQLLRPPSRCPFIPTGCRHRGGFDDYGRAGVSDDVTGTTRVPCPSH
jgi:hypothetical protein